MMESQMFAGWTATEVAIYKVEREISHTTDGPVTRFVLISRAMDLVAKGIANPEIVSNALYNLLTDGGC